MFRRSIKRVPGLVLPGVIVLLPMALILLQPDLGTALLLPAAAMAMLFAVGARPRHILPMAVIVVALIGAVFFVCLRYDAETIAQRVKPIKVYQVKRKMMGRAGYISITGIQGASGQNAELSVMSL